MSEGGTLSKIDKGKDGNKLEPGEGDSSEDDERVEDTEFPLADYLIYK